MEKVRVQFCKTKEEVLNSDVLWDSIDAIFSKFKNGDKYKTIADKIRNRKGISLDEYHIFSNFLKNPSFLEEARKDYDKLEIYGKVTEIRDSLDNILLESILLNVKELAVSNLVSVLRTDDKTGDIFERDGKFYMIVRTKELEIVEVVEKVKIGSTITYIVLFLDGQKAVSLPSGYLISSYSKRDDINKWISSNRTHFIATKILENGDKYQSMFDIDGKEITSQTFPSKDK